MCAVSGGKAATCFRRFISTNDAFSLGYTQKAFVFFFFFFSLVILFVYFMGVPNYPSGTHYIVSLHFNPEGGG